MSKPPAVLMGLLLWGGLLAGCHGVGKSGLTGRSDRPVTVPTAFEPHQARDLYIESHYEQHLKAGRVTNADEARALAAHDWEAHERHRNDSTQSSTWSSADAAKREQKQFEKELPEMELK